MRGAPAASNSIYRIDPEQGAGRVARFNQAFVLSLGFLDDMLLAGVGPGGRLAGIEQDQLIRIVTQLEPAHITAIAGLPDGGSVIGTANGGGVWLLKRQLRQEGSLVSKPFDAGYLSRWGRVSWEERTGTGQQVRMKLRTGNTGEPDEHWSGWSEWIAAPAGSEVPGLPMGRFAQFSAELSTAPGLGTPVLLEATVSYRQSNRKPRIEDIAVDGQSLLTGQQQGGQRQQRGPRRPRSNGADPAKLTIAWKAADPNEDDLAFDLYYRGVEAKSWKVLEENIRDKANYEWDTTRVPGGAYLLKLVARDRPSRPAGEAMSDVRLSTPVTIDNRPPAVQDLQAERLDEGAYRLTGVAADDFSPIDEVEVSHNSGEWQPVFADDGILDSREEPFSHVTQVLEPGEHTFVFAATDSRDNTGSGKVVVEVAGPE
jgi:hypothetical protein